MSYYLPSQEPSYISPYCYSSYKPYKHTYDLDISSSTRNNLNLKANNNAFKSNRSAATNFSTRPYQQNLYYGVKLQNDHKLDRTLLNKPGFLIKMDKIYPDGDWATANSSNNFCQRRDHISSNLGIYDNCSKKGFYTQNTQNDRMIEERLALAQKYYHRDLNIKSNNARNNHSSTRERQWRNRRQAGNTGENGSQYDQYDQRQPQQHYHQRSYDYKRQRYHNPQKYHQANSLAIDEYIKSIQLEDMNRNWRSDRNQNQSRNSQFNNNNYRNSEDGVNPIINPKSNANPITNASSTTGVRKVGGRIPQIHNEQSDQEQSKGQAGQIRKSEEDKRERYSNNSNNNNNNNNNNISKQINNRTSILSKQSSLKMKRNSIFPQQISFRSKTYQKISV